MSGELQPPARDRDGHPITGRRRNPHRTRQALTRLRSLHREPCHQPPWTEHLAHLRCDDTYTQLAAGFGIGIATVCRFVREAIDVLAALASTLNDAMVTTCSKTYGILDGTVLPIGPTIRHEAAPRRERPGADRSVRPTAANCCGLRPHCPTQHMTQRHAVTASSTPRPTPTSSAWPVRRIRARPATFALRSRGAASSGGNDATTTPMPRSATSASRPWPRSRTGASCAIGSTSGQSARCALWPTCATACPPSAPCAATSLLGLPFPAPFCHAE
ncbi:hypothetical protein EAO73_12070 [Streptomyces sp. col6]|nr:hypothetical protein EAO73_12070 [Streptomyces sp. col6]